MKLKKKQIDQYITKKVSENKGIPLNQVLDEVERAYLDQLKNKLLELKKEFGIEVKPKSPKDEVTQEEILKLSNILNS